MRTSSVRAIGMEHAKPILHDFPYRTCANCGFPIPAHDLVNDDYRPRHRSSCDEEPIPSSTPTGSGVSDRPRAGG